MKLFLAVVVAFFVVLPIGNSAAVNDDDFFVSRSCRLDQKFCTAFELGWVGGGISAQHMALQIRDIPIHPGDGYVRCENQGPISKLNFGATGTLQNPET